MTQTPSVVSPPHRELPSLSAIIRGDVRRIAAVAFLVSALIVVLGLIGKREWSARSSFLPQSRRAQSGLSAIAAQFGVSTPNMEGQPTPQFFADLLTSRELLRRLVEAGVDSGGRRVAIATLLNVTEKDSARRQEATVDAVVARTGTEVSPKTGQVTLQVRMPTAWAAYAVNKTLLDLLMSFNLESRRSQAGAERKFSEGRALEAGNELRQAENRQRDFLQRNRTITSPELLLERDRLAREVLMRQQLYTSLLQAYEQARMEEVRDTPTITMVESPRPPARPVSRRIAIKAMMGLMLGALLASVWSLWRASRRL